MHGLALALLGLAAAGCGPKTQGPPPLMLVVKTQPPGAKAVLDEQPLGTTPLRRAVPTGRHVLALSLAGHETLWLPLAAAATGELLVEQALRPLSAAVIVESVPPGAALTVDGEQKGTTPVFLAQLAFGKHAAALALPGHAARQFQIVIDNARPRKVRENLESVVSVLEVWSKPGGAEVFVGDKPYGVTPDSGEEPLIINDLVAGTYTVTLRRSGYKPVAQPVVLQAQQKYVLKPAALLELPARVEITSEPPGAEVYDATGTQLGTTPYTSAEMPSGTYAYQVKKVGFVAETKSVAVPPGVVQQVRIKLTKNTGDLAFSTEPPGCTVFVDGTNVGRTVAADSPRVSKMFEHEALLPGTHTLELQHPEYETYTTRFEVGQGQAKRLGVVKLKKRWIPTHRLKLKSGTEYDGVLLRKNPDGSVDFERAPTTKVGYGATEVDSITPLPKAKP